MCLHRSVSLVLTVQLMEDGRMDTTSCSILACSGAQERRTQYLVRPTHPASFLDVLRICLMRSGSSKLMMQRAPLSSHIRTWRSIMRRYIHTFTLSCFTNKYKCTNGSGTGGERLAVQDPLATHHCSLVVYWH